MAPRNNDASTSYKKNFPVEDSDISIKDIVPCLLHKKHKVVKLVKNQMQKIDEEGLLCSTSGTDVEDVEEVEIGMRRLKRGVGPDERQDVESGYGRRSRLGSGTGSGSGSGTGSGTENARLPFMVFFSMLLLMLFLLMLLMVWITAGPLSNTIPHTPVPAGSFVHMEGICSLEKKYLLRWSKPQYFE